MRIAWYTQARPLNGSRIQPPKHVAAPPNGSISVGWLWVSFLNNNNHSSVFPSTSTGTMIVHALISSDSSRFVKPPAWRNSFTASVAMSMRERAFFLVVQSSERPSMYSSRASSIGPVKRLASIEISVNSVINVVWRQWSDQYVSKRRISVIVGSRCSTSAYCCLII